MKKIISLVLCLMMLCIASAAFAAEYQPGDTVKVTVSVSTSDGAVMAKIKVSASTDVFEFVEAKLSGVSGSAPNHANGVFAINSPDSIAHLSGTIGYITLRIKDNVAPGSYPISLTASQIFDTNFESAHLSVSGGTTVVIPKPACDHTWDDGVETTAPTCDKDGVKTYTCSKCNETKTEAIPAIGHAYDDGVVTTPATCIGEGVKTYTCANCQGTYTDKIAATGEHTWDAGVVKSEPTCTEAGVTVFTCTVCKETDETTVPKKGHTPSDTAVRIEPTCTENGSISYKCTVCGVEVDGEVIPATDHKWDDGVVTTPAACGKAGVKTYTCQNDKSHTKTETIAALQHAWDNGVVTTPATCVDKGVLTYTCSNCSITKTEEIPATGKHTPGSDVIRVEPTCEKDGSTSFSCTVCGTKIDGEVLTKLGHAWGDGVVTTEATCTKKGEKTYTCANDASHTKTETIKATGKHIFDEGVVTTPATCTKDGKKTYTCTYGCGKTKTETIKRLGHAYDEGVVTTEPTCETTGVKTYTCANDASHTKTEKLAKLGHAWGEWVITKPVTEEEAGEQQRTCERCGKVEIKKISNKVDYQMTVCSNGIRFRDLDNPITDKWYMFTPVDLSVEGEQTYDLIAGNMHNIGTVTVLVKEGTVTVTYKVNSKSTIFVYEEFMTILPNLASVTELDFETMTNYAYGEAISIEETLGGDTKVLLLMCNKAMYKEDAAGVHGFDAKGKKRDAYVESLMLLMD